MEKYVNLSKREFSQLSEVKKVKKRLQLIKDEIISSIKQLPPKSISGIKDCYEKFKIIHDEGYHLSIKQFCPHGDSKTENCESTFLECDSVCDMVAKRIFAYLSETMPNFISKWGVKESYFFHKLKRTKKPANLSSDL